MDVELRPIGPDEVETFARVNNAAFGCAPSQEQVDRQRPELAELERTLAAFAGGQMVATAAAHSMELTLPGARAVPMAGVTWVGVQPVHRRQGLLRAMMRHQLDDVHERGEPLAGLAASEGGIYGRFGYGPATWGVAWELNRSRARLAAGPPPGGHLDLVDAGTAREALPPVHEAIRTRRTGDVPRMAFQWDDMVQADPGSVGRHGDGAKLFVVHRGPGGDADGYAVYRMPRDEMWSSRHTVRVDHMEAATREAYVSLWAYLCDLDLSELVVAGDRPAAEPLRHLLDDARQLRVTASYDHLWVRLVDLPAALAARAYAAPGALVVEVADPFCPWNEGRWRLEAGAEGADCRRARPGEAAELALDVATLAGAYMGGASLATLAWAGRVEELVPGALARAGAMLAVDPPPFCSSWF
ncbi:MAG: GNAT family N-acetyltransferase [Acidimicrobiales bacterium]